MTFLILYYLYQFFYNTEFDILEAISNLFKLLASGLTYNLFFLNNSSTNLNNSNNKVQEENIAISKSENEISYASSNVSEYYSVVSGPKNLIIHKSIPTILTGLKIKI